MTAHRNKNQDIKLTDVQIQNKETVIRKEQSWLDHTQGGAELDYDLLQGATVEEMMKSSGRTEGAVLGHVRHLDVEHGLVVSEKDGFFKLEISRLKGKVTNKNQYLFQEVQLEHIEKALNDYQRKGVPEGFGPSIAYDVIIHGTCYSPKPIMAYANFYATRRKPGNYFSGGKNTPCFRAYERLGIEIIEKNKNMNEELYRIKEDFLKEWPIERLKTMTLEEYTNSDKTSFCYWLEAKTTDIGSIWGGSAYKFGIFKRKDLESKEFGKIRMSDGEYSWLGKYGQAKDEAFEKIRNIIIQIATFSYENRLIEIDNIDLGDAVKWKIAFLYNDYNVINIFNLQALRKSSKYLGFDKITKSYSELNRFIISKRGNKDFFDFAKELWLVFDNEKIIKDKFKKWLKDHNGASNNKVTSYLKAIDILKEQFKIEVYNNENFEYLKELYDDLLLHQKTINGKYYYSKAKSYGTHGFYSAAVKSFIQFLESTEEENDEATNPSNEPETSYSKTMNIPLNKILYGPPGTGKTYNTLVKAAEIVSGEEISNYNEAKRIFNEHLGNQIEFITFHQNYSYEDFIQGLRPDVENNNTLTFDRKDGIFLEISKRALENLEMSEMETEELNRESRFNEALGRFIESIEESDEDFQIPDSVAKISEVTDKSFRYQGANWAGHGSLMKFNDLREFYRADVQTRQDIKHLSTVSGLANWHASYFLRVYNEILKFLPADNSSADKIEKKNYVIIIDEINRANISRVFGELITLIEPDKRSHGEIPLKCKLPSGEEFMVPSNLYIIGTMNTADKSIALLDIALRRRFVFEAMYPKYDITDQEVYDVEILRKINKKIIDLKGHDFQIGHAYFMGDNDDLVKRMNQKVIPLLLEYFMNDEKEVKSILTNAELEIEENTWPLKISGKRDKSI